MASKTAWVRLRAACHVDERNTARVMRDLPDGSSKRSGFVGEEGGGGGAGGGHGEGGGTLVELGAGHGEGGGKRLCWCGCFSGLEVVFSAAAAAAAAQV